MPLWQLQEPVRKVQYHGQTQAKHSHVEMVKKSCFIFSLISVSICFVPLLLLSSLGPSITCPMLGWGWLEGWIQLRLWSSVPACGCFCMVVLRLVIRFIYRVTTVPQNKHPSQLARRRVEQRGTYCCTKTHWPPCSRAYFLVVSWERVHENTPWIFAYLQQFNVFESYCG